MAGDNTEIASGASSPTGTSVEQQLSKTWAARLPVSPRLLLVAGISIALIFILFHTYDFRQVQAAAASISLATLTAVVLALLVGTLLSCVRYRAVLALLGIDVPVRLAAHAQLIGVIGGLMFFQVIGQTLARTAVLERHGVRGPAVLFANILERLTAMIWLFVLMVCGLLYLFGNVLADGFGVGVGGIKFSSVFLLVAIVTALWSCRRLTKLGFTRLVDGMRATGAASVSVYSVTTHQLTMIAFILLGRAVAPEVPLLDLAAASLIVMFAASVPISFAGWGLREVGAVYAYQAVGISGEKALAVSILIGVFSLIVVLVMGLASTVFAPGTFALQREAEVRVVKVSAGITRGLSWAVPLLCAALILFQVYLPVKGGSVNVNLADPIAIGGGLIFLSRYRGMAHRGIAWRIPGVELFVVAATVVLGLGLLIGWSRFGLTDWALYNRFFGWFVLLAYSATGALAAGANYNVGRTLLFRGILLAGLAIAFAEMVFLLLVSIKAIDQGFVPQTHLAGMSQNTNAFAIQMIVLICIICAGVSPLSGKSSKTKERLRVAALSIAVFALYAAHSRTGYIVSGAVILGTLLLGYLSWRTLLGGLLGAVSLGVLFSLSIYTISGGAGALAMKLQDVSSDGERSATIAGGMRLWLAHPLFGAGLGAFAEAVRVETGKILVIHNTALWLLAELGLVGISVFAAFFGNLAYAVFKDRASNDVSVRVLLLVLGSAALFQLPHDVFYQRIYWLILGAALFTVRLPRPN